MAVVQDGAPTAARTGKAVRAAELPLTAVRGDLRWVNCAVPAGGGKRRVGSARRSPAVEHHPMRDGVTAVRRMVVQASGDFGGELSLRIGVTGGAVAVVLSVPLALDTGPTVHCELVWVWVYWRQAGAEAVKKAPACLADGNNTTAWST